MKRTIEMILMTLVIVLFAALMGMTLISCENDEKTDVDDSIIHVLKMRTDVDATTYQQLTAFFQEELHSIYWDGNNNEFPGFFGKLEWDEQPCYLINSMDEFQAAYKGNKALPEIDFSKYSVLVGRTYRIDGSESLSKFTLVDEGDHYRMALSILHNINPNYAYTCDIGDLFYWDVYSKQESKPIIVERNVEKKVVNIM